MSLTAARFAGFQQDSIMTEKEINSPRAILLASFLAALSAALLWFSLLNVPLLPILFGIGITVPIYFLIFAVNLRSGFLAVCLASVLLCFALPLTAAPAVAAFFFPPALLTGWLLNLKYTAPDSAGARQKAELAFYPLSAALFQLALAVAFVTIGALFYIFSAPDTGSVFDALTAQIIQFMQDNNLYDLPAQDGDISLSLRRLLPTLFAVSLALYGFLFQLAALYCALRLCARKSLLKRPLPFWPAALRMPPLAFITCILLWAASYFIGGSGETDAPTLALCVNIILSVLAVGFCVSGLAVLHLAARGGWAWLRILIYICLFSLVLTPVIFFGLVIMGLFATPFPRRNRRGNSPSA